MIASNSGNNAMINRVKPTLDKYNVTLTEARSRIRYIAERDTETDILLTEYQDWKSMQLNDIERILRLSFGEVVDGYSFPEFIQEITMLSDIALIHTQFGYVPVIKFCTVLRSQLAKKYLYPGMGTAPSQAMANYTAYSLFEHKPFDIEFPIFASTMDIHRAATELAQLQAEQECFCIKDNGFFYFVSPEELQKWFLTCFTTPCDIPQLTKLGAYLILRDKDNDMSASTNYIEDFYKVAKNIEKHSNSLEFYMMDAFMVGADLFDLPHDVDEEEEP